MPSAKPALRKFGDNIRLRREAHDLSQEQRADLDRTLISDVDPVHSVQM